MRDKQNAYSFAQPRLAEPGYFNMGPASSSVLVYGPYLVRNATLSQDGETLSLFGDTNATTAINIFAPKSITSFKWNGATIATSTSSIGSQIGVIKFKYSGLGVKLPSLSSNEWKVTTLCPRR